MKSVLILILSACAVLAQPSLNGPEAGVFKAAAAAGGDVTSGLIARWKLNDGSGSTAVDDIGGHNITLSGSPTWITGPNGNGALQFVAASSQSGSVTIDLTGLSKFTVSCWLYWNAFADDNLGPFYFVDSGNNQWQVDPDYGGFAVGHSGFGLAEYNQGTGGLYNAVYATRPSAAAWHHIVGVFDATGTTGLAEVLYIDGSAATLSQGENNATPSFGSGTLNVMKTFGTYSNGRLDDIRIYNRALTSGEVSTLFSNGAQ